jgi:methane monooxygenase PmoA-like
MLFIPPTPPPHVNSTFPNVPPTAHENSATVPVASPRPSTHLPGTRSRGGSAPVRTFFGASPPRGGGRAAQKVRHDVGAVAPARKWDICPLDRFVAVAVCLAVFTIARSRAAESGVKITELPDKLRVEIGGELFTEYCYKGAPHVYFYPVIGPGGAKMTRDWPMKDVPGEEHDHPHHRSLWFAHGEVNGVDFWAEPKSFAAGKERPTGQIVHDKFLDVKSDGKEGVIKSLNKWVAPDGTVVLTSEQTVRIYNRPATERLFDFEVTLKAGDKPVVFGDTKEGSMACRVNESIRVTKGKKEPGQGHLVSSEGVRDVAVWGKRANWCDYSGPIDGKTLGIAIFDHPQNPRHPSWWHARDYGLFAVNPFGQHDFEKKPPHTGDMTVEPGKSVTFRYRFYIHEGDEKQAKVAERYAEYAKD